jgi:hypothetical protein
MRRPRTTQLKHAFAPAAQRLGAPSAKHKSATNRRNLTAHRNEPRARNKEMNVVRPSNAMTTSSDNNARSKNAANARSVNSEFNENGKSKKFRKRAGVKRNRPVSNKSIRKMSAGNRKVRIGAEPNSKISHRLLPPAMMRVEHRGTEDAEIAKWHHGKVSSKLTSTGSRLLNFDLLPVQGTGHALL